MQAEQPCVRTWIFQTVPRRYRLLDALRNEPEELWEVNQHRDEVRLGDRVLVWLAGPDAGLYAVGTVMSEPKYMRDFERSLRYWAADDDGPQPNYRVLVHYDQVLLDRPLLRSLLKDIPELATLSILRFAQGTNFAVTEQERNAIWALLDG